MVLVFTAIILEVYSSYKEKQAKEQEKSIDMNV